MVDQAAHGSTLSNRLPSSRLNALLVLMPVLMPVLMVGCASAPTPVNPSAPAASAPSSPGTTPAVTTPDNGAAAATAAGPVDRLLDEARRFRDAGDLASSFSRLERALRIAPQRAEVYLELARNYQLSRNPERAAASAERGLLFCSAGEICQALRRLAKS